MYACLSACISVHQACAFCPQNPEELIRSPGNGALDGCELQYGFQESNLGPLEEHLPLLTTEPSSNPLIKIN